MPTVKHSDLTISLAPGEVVTLVGPNGAGKSALIFWMSQNSAVPVSRIVAHRRIWLTSSGPELTASSREQYSGILSYHDNDPKSRTSGEYEEQRVSGVLYDLMGKENGRNSRFARRFELGDTTINVEPSLLTTISKIMQASGFDMHFEITDNMGFDVVHESERYPISAMSDGEKAALLLAAEVLLAPAGSVQLLDEPERHFHRSISPKLIAALIEARPDCGFVVSTHDLDLVDRMNLNNSIYLIKKINWSPKGTPTGWDIQKAPDGEPINESARRAVFGGRKKILFVEGESGSLDLMILSIIFPEYSVIPAGSSDNVQRAVSGLRSTNELHWVSAKGIIDGDARNSEEIEKLREKQILVLPVNEIESLYYLPEVIEIQARLQAEHLGTNWQDLFNDAKAKALENLCHPGVCENLAASNASKILRRSALASLPNKNDLKAAGSITFDLQSPYAEQLSQLHAAVEQQDLMKIVKEFSIRDSGFPTAVAKALGYGSKEIYQRAVTATVQRNTELRQTLKNLIDDDPPK